METKPHPGGNPANTPTPALLDVRQVAALLGCSSRHVARMADMGTMPDKIKLSNLSKWRRSDIEAWIAGGCKPVRTMGRVR